MSHGFTYEAATGHIHTISATGGENLEFGYDGPLVTSVVWSGPVSASLALDYDDNFHIAAENGIQFRRELDGRATQAGDEYISYDDYNGLLVHTTLYPVLEDWTYNGFGETLSYTVKRNEVEIFRRDYTRDDVGRISRVVESSGGSTSTADYVYDTPGRLTDVAKDGSAVEHYEYDANSNRLGGTYDDQDRMTSYGGATYTYTANGELETKTDNGGTTRYTYDEFGNLLSVNLPDGRTIEYVIDAMGRRVGKKVNGTLAQGWLYGGQLRIIAELDGSGATVSKFVYGSRTNAPDYMVKNGVTYKIISDQVGSPRVIINIADGSVAETIAYDSFGNVLSDTNPGFQPFGFAGAVYDRDTNLVHFGARDYDPHVGRWTAKDPILFAGRQVNLFMYNFGDPVNFIDPSGLGTVDANVSWPLPGSAGGGTVGIQFSNSGIYPYAGVGFVSSPGWSIMASEEDASAGMFDSASANVPGVPLLVIGAARPASNSCEIRQVSWQAGIGTKGVNVVRTKTLGEAHPVTWFQQFFEEGARQIQRLYGVP